MWSIHMHTHTFSSEDKRAKQHKQLSKDHTRAHARTLACGTVLNAKLKDTVLVAADKRVCARARSVACVVLFAETRQTQNRETKKPRKR